MSTLKIAIVGPESSGKTTLTEALARHYRCAFTREFAREYLNRFGPAYTEEDLVRIAGGQVLEESRAERAAREEGGRLVVCDTDMITIRIWSEEKFGRCDATVMDLTQEVHYDLWLLCRPDMPWSPDPLRENPFDRERLFGVYQALLDRERRPYVVMEGDHERRLTAAKAVIDQAMG